MDPVTIGAVLLAIVSGAGGELGTRLWDGAVELVRRPFHRPAPGDSSAPMPTGDAELAALERDPADERKAVALAAALVARADTDAEFRQALENWWERASLVRTSEGNVTNSISGGAQQGPVLQGRDSSNVTFGSAPAVLPVMPSTDQGA